MLNLLIKDGFIMDKKEIKYEYSKEETAIYFDMAVNLLCNRFPNIISKEEAYRRIDLLGKNLQIDFSIDREGKYDIYGTGIFVNSDIIKLVSFIYDEKKLNFLLHELIHKIQKNIVSSYGTNELLVSLKKNGLERTLIETKGMGMKEAGTEFTARVCFNESQRNLVFMGSTAFSTIGSKAGAPLLSIIEQMHFLLKSDSVFDSTINSNNKFRKEFSKKYGSITYKEIESKLDAFYSGDKKDWELFKYIQDYLLKKCFDKEFKRARTKEEKLQVFKELKEFERYRCKIKGDDFYRNYYEDKLKELKQFYEKKRLDQSELADLEYEEIEFFCSEKQKDEFAAKRIITDLGILPTDMSTLISKYKPYVVDQEVSSNKKNLILVSDDTIVHVSYNLYKEYDENSDGINITTIYSFRKNPEKYRKALEEYFGENTPHILEPYDRIFDVIAEQLVATNIEGDYIEKATNKGRQDRNGFHSRLVRNNIATTSGDSIVTVRRNNDDNLR